MRRVIAYSLFTAFGTAAFGQALVAANSSLNASGQAVYNVLFSFRQEPFTEPVVPNAPYSADEMLDTIRIQGDDRRVEQSAMTRRVSRDAQGRIRIERRLSMGPVAPNGPEIVEIIDPAAALRYVIDPDKKIAHRSHLLMPGEKPQMSLRADSPSPMVATAGGEAGAPPRAKTEQNQTAVNGSEPAVATLSTAPPPPSPSESLGTRTIEGIEAQGTRYTYRAAGRGPDGAKASTTELWVAWKQQLTLVSKLDATDGSETTTSLKNVKWGEPAASLFQVPADYRLQDESGTFEIQFLIAPPTAN